MPGKYISADWLSERIAIRVEHIARPTRKQIHDALNATIKDLQETYGEIDIPQYPYTGDWAVSG